MSNPIQLAPVELAKSYRLLNHGPTTLVTSAHNGVRNIMAAAWAMPLDFDPPKVLLVVDSRTLTRELIEASGVFALNIPTRAIAETTLTVTLRPRRRQVRSTRPHQRTGPHHRRAAGGRLRSVA